jgi:hypothetical protein
VRIEAYRLLAEARVSNLLARAPANPADAEPENPDLRIPLASIEVIERARCREL